MSRSVPIRSVGISAGSFQKDSAMRRRCRHASRHMITHGRRGIRLAVRPRENGTAGNGAGRITHDSPTSTRVHDRRGHDGALRLGTPALRRGRPARARRGRLRRHRSGKGSVLRIQRRRGHHRRFGARRQRGGRTLGHHRDRDPPARPLHHDHARAGLRAGARGHLRCPPSSRMSARSRSLCRSRFNSRRGRTPLRRSSSCRLRSARCSADSSRSSAPRPT